MNKRSGAGINLIFFVLALLLTSALVCIGLYAYFHESDHEAKPASAPTVLATTEATATASTSTSATTAATTTASAIMSTTTTTTVSKLKYHGFNETVAADPSKAVFTLSEEESGDLFHYYPNSEWTFRGFADKATVGIAKDKVSKASSYYINTPEVKDSKSDIGFTAEIKNGKTLKVESYGGELSELRIVSNNDKYADLGCTADVKKGTLEADLCGSSFPNGLYVINAEYTVGDKTCDLNICLFVNCKSDDEKDYSFYLCTASQGDIDAETTTTTTTTVSASSETTTTTTTSKAN